MIIFIHICQVAISLFIHFFSANPKSKALSDITFRRIMRISWTEKKSNEEVMEMAGKKRSLLKTIRKRQLQLFWAYKQS